jgi:hypothetical protein
VGFFVIQPEASGRPDPGTAAEGEASCSFDTWLGDDLVSAHPLLLVTTPLKEALEGLNRPRGFSFGRVRATPSGFFQRYNPGRRLPRFWSLEVHGRPGLDDTGIAGDGSLVASARVVAVMAAAALKHATLSQYTPSASPTDRAARVVRRP